MSELKPCPFCGGEIIYFDFMESFMTATCSECHIRFEKCCVTKEEAIESWNEREGA